MLVNVYALNDERVVGVVEIGAKDVSRQLLRAGVARFKEPAPYSVSRYSEWLYRI